MTQDVLPLLLFEIFPRPRLEVAAHLDDGDLLAQQVVDGLKERLGVVDLQDLLLLRLLDVVGEHCDAVHLDDRIVDRAHHLVEHLIGVLRVLGRCQVGNPPGGLQVVAHQCHGLRPLLSRFREHR